jgi:hypothetical protein
MRVRWKVEIFCCASRSDFRTDIDLSLFLSMARCCSSAFFLSRWRLWFRRFRTSFFFSSIVVFRCYRRDVARVAFYLFTKSYASSILNRSSSCRLSFSSIIASFRARAVSTSCARFLVSSIFRLAFISSYFSRFIRFASICASFSIWRRWRCVVARFRWSPPL